ncbi:hypothetical protein ACIQVR_38235 [Streptomyces xanthochromogenes]|uniref:hypothetical protein n=1 Tax=Streptomyces xanthochromogenes TaxID=67384 RepID=UPI00382135D3
MNTERQSTGAAVQHREGRRARLCTLAAAAVLAAVAGGCASENATTPASTGTVTSTSASTPAGTSAPPDSAMRPGMQMPGMTRAAAPSASALMVCGPEIREDVVKILAPPHAPTTTTTWTDHLYTCTYHLPTGRLVLSVKESPDTASANTYFQALRKQLGTTTPLTAAQGLGNPGYESAGGTVVILKDGKTLRVDATGMPATSGPHQLSRADLAYEVASDILGCWSE